MDNLSVRGRVRQFDLENGNDAITIGDNSFLYFSNGAKRDVEPMGILLDPPKDDYERYSNIVKYHGELLRRAKAEFNEEASNFREGNELAFRNRNTPSFTKEDVLQALEPLKAKVQGHQKRLDEAQKLLQATSTWKYRESIQEEKAEATRACIEMNSFINTIRI